MTITDPVNQSAKPAAGLLALAIAASVATLLLITIGSLVRVTESGLACPDWPLCQGQLIPPFEFHVLIEYTHRLSAVVVSILVVALFVVSLISTITRRGAAQRIFLPASIALAFLVGQIALGGVTVLTELPPAIVTLHLAIAEAIFATLLVVTLRAADAGRTADQTTIVPSASEADKLLRWALIASAATFAVILSGAYVVAGAATSACGSGFSSWPLCDGALNPSGQLQAIHMGHRFVVIVGTVVTLQAVRIGWRQRSWSRGIARVSLITAHLLVVQIIIGALIPWFRFTEEPRVLHVTLATATWGALIVLTLLAIRAKNRGVAQTSPSPDDIASNAQSSSSRGLSAFIADLFWLTKPRVMILLLVTAFGGMVLATEGLPSLGLTAVVLLGGALASGGAGSINQGLEGPLDAAMLRTRNRPVASGRVAPIQAIVYGVILNVFAFVVLAAGANLLAALIAIGGAVFYVFVYTLWLKRTTVQNIVIGGAAGAVPPLVGWAGVTGGLDLPAFYLFAIIFFWTPPHFWALALLIQEDYARAEIPMMPVVRGEEQTRWVILLYVVMVNVLAILFYISTQSLGVIYLGSALILGGFFTYYAVRLLRDKHRTAALRLYKYSLLYLALFFLVVMVDASI